MKVISFILATIMLALSLVTPAAALKETDSVYAQSTNSAQVGFLNKETEKVISAIVSNIVNEAKTGTSESDEVLELINNLPVYEAGEEKPDRQSVNVGPFKKYFDKALKDLINKTLPEGTIRNFLNHLTSGMYDLYVYLVPITGEENVYFFCCDYVDDNGEVHVVLTGVRYNKETGKIYGKDNNGLMGIGFDYDAKNYTITTPVNVWMRDLGYSVFFDILGNLGFMKTDTARVKFEYGGKYWMFQFWKGNYGFNLLNGAELGIYNKTDKNAFSYNCATDEEMLAMSTVLRDGDKVLIEREEMKHWWICGFRFGPPADLDNLVMESTIDFEDEGMKDAFLDAAKEFSDEMAITCVGNKVMIIWK